MSALAQAEPGRWSTERNGFSDSNGWIRPRVENAPGGAKLTVQIHHGDARITPVTIALQAVVNDGKNNLQTFQLQILDDRYRGPDGQQNQERSYRIDYEKLNAQLRRVAPHLPNVRIGPGTPLFVKAVFDPGGNNHNWGGPTRNGIFYLPAADGTTPRPPEVTGTAPGARAETLDIAHPITWGMTDAYNRNGRGLKPGGQYRSRLEGEGKYQVQAADFARVQETLRALAADPQKAKELLGDDWTLERLTKYLKPDGSPDPMVDTYCDNADHDAAKLDMGLRYRWTEGNRTGAWNFKPGIGTRSAEGLVYRVEYGIDTTDDRPESLAPFADSDDPLNPFRPIREILPGARPSDFLHQSLRITDYRDKFILKHKSGLEIELSLDDVHALALRAGADGKNGEGHFYQLEADIGHLATKSSNIPNAGLNPNDVYSQFGLSGMDLSNHLRGLPPGAFLDGRAVVHTEEDTDPQSPLRQERLEEFKTAEEAIRKLRTHLLGEHWIPGAQKYAYAAYAAGLVSDGEASASVQLTLDHEFLAKLRGGEKAEDYLKHAERGMRWRAIRALNKELLGGRPDHAPDQEKLKALAEALAIMSRDHEAPPTMRAEATLAYEKLATQASELLSDLPSPTELRADLIANLNRASRLNPEQRLANERARFALEPSLPRAHELADALRDAASSPRANFPAAQESRARALEALAPHVGDPRVRAGVQRLFENGGPHARRLASEFLTSLDAKALASPQIKHLLRALTVEPKTALPLAKQALDLLNIVDPDLASRSAPAFIRRARAHDRTQLTALANSPNPSIARAATGALRTTCGEHFRELVDKTRARIARVAPLAIGATVVGGGIFTMVDLFRGFPNYRYLLGIKTSREQAEESCLKRNGDFSGGEYYTTCSCEMPSYHVLKDDEVCNLTEKIFHYADFYTEYLASDLNDESSVADFHFREVNLHLARRLASARELFWNGKKREAKREADAIQKEAEAARTELRKARDQERWDRRSADEETRRKQCQQAGGKWTSNCICPDGFELGRWDLCNHPSRKQVNIDFVRYRARSDIAEANKYLAALRGLPNEDGRKKEFSVKLETAVRDATYLRSIIELDANWRFKLESLQSINREARWRLQELVER